MLFDCIGIYGHRSEFVATKMRALATNARSCVNRGTRRIALDQESDRGEQRRSQQQPHTCPNQIDGSFDDERGHGQMLLIESNQGPTPHLGDVARGAVHKIRNEYDVKMAQSRHADCTSSSSGIVRSNYQLVDKMSARQALEICNSTKN